MDYFRNYQDFVRRNCNLLAVVETGLSTLTWLLPDRFTDNELSLEAVHTAINLLSAFHDSLINDPAPCAPRGASELTFALSALQQAQVLVELWGQYSQRIGTLESHYDPLIAVEGLKAVVRLAILRSSGCRILANGGSTTFDPVLGVSKLRAHAGPGSEARAREVFAAFAAFREEQCVPLAPQDDSAAAAAAAAATEPEPAAEKKEIRDMFWWEGGAQQGEHESWRGHCALRRSGAALGAQRTEALRSLERRSAVQQAASARLVIAGELLHVLRPLVYVATLRRWGRRSWRPWALALSLDFASSRLAQAGAKASRRAAAEAAEDPAVAGTALAVLYGAQGLRWRRDEADELTRRKVLMLWALLRDPFFSRFTGPAIDRWRQRLERVPLAGRAADKAAELLLGVQKYYTYTAAS